MEKEEWDEIVEKWLKPIKYKQFVTTNVDRKYEELKEQNKIIYEALKNAGKPHDPWLIKEDPERKLGFQAQKCFSEILWALNITNYSDLKQECSNTVEKLIKNQESLMKLGFTIEEWKDIKYRLEIAWDIIIPYFGKIEVKCWNPEEPTINIKERAWSQKPSTYLCVMKHSKGKFQFIGWLYGYQVFTLPIQPKTHHGTAFYYIKQSELNEPRQFLDKLYKPQ